MFSLAHMRSCCYQFLLFRVKKVYEDGNFSSFTLFRTLAGLKGKGGLFLHLHMVILNHRITGTGGLICCPLPLHSMPWLCFSNLQKKQEEHGPQWNTVRPLLPTDCSQTRSPSITSNTVSFSTQGHSDNLRNIPIFSHSKAI